MYPETEAIFIVYKYEFNIFKNCKDYNAFIQPLYAEGVQECKKQQVNIWEVRKAMEKIK